ncbi:MAG: hypothetical protein E6K14_06500 [Methanobacteriota archaeon]|nr:MAG: hypothetical protein E6K14_06500 [Euryarchaeota archaeon]
MISLAHGRLVGGREAEPTQPMGARAASGPQRLGPGERWELSNEGGAPAILTREQIVEALLNRSVSMNARIRPQGSGQWYVPEAFPELEPACASVSFARSGVSPKQASGMVVISSSVPRLLDLSKKLRHGSGARKPEFFLPILNKDPGVTMVTWTQLFAVWDRFYVGCVLESHYVKPGQPLNVFLIGMNCSDKPQARALAPSGFRPPDSRDLAFTLSPFQWDVNHFPLGTPADAQQHTLGFRTISTAGKVATAAAVGILTLGTFVYAPGHKGFSVSYKVLEPKSVQSIVSVEQSALRALTEAFQDHQAEALVGPGGERFPKDRVLEWFRYYLGANPETIVHTLNAEKDRSKVVPSLFNQFLGTEFPDGTWFPPAPS